MDISPLPLFPELELLDARVEGEQLVIALKNAGAFTIRTRTYGQPEYRLIAKLFDGGREVQDRWLALPRDLPPGATATVTFAVLPPQPQLSLRLYHAIQDIPMLDPEPWGEVRIVR
jgi:hypothetical protein